MLKKEILELYLLHLLSRQEQYGYEILRMLQGHFPDIQESAIYALLRNLCREDYLETYTSDISGGPARKYYHITPRGYEQLNILLKEWIALQNMIKSLGISGDDI